SQLHLGATPSPAPSGRAALPDNRNADLAAPALRVFPGAGAPTVGIEQDPHMARRAFVVNDAARERVRYLAGVGVRQDDIAKIVGCAPKTLRKRFRDDLDRGVAEANATMCGFLFAAAKAGNIPAIIFWLKTRAHWRERVAANDPSANADVGSNSDMVLVLPANSRAPQLTPPLQ